MKTALCRFQRGDLPRRVGCDFFRDRAQIMIESCRIDDIMILITGNEKQVDRWLKQFETMNM